MKSTEDTDSCCETHNRGKATTADMRWAHSLHDPETNGRGGSESTGNGVVRRASISEDSTQVSVMNVS